MSVDSSFVLTMLEDKRAGYLQIFLHLYYLALALLTTPLIWTMKNQPENNL
jgi:hypothetical protein